MHKLKLQRKKNLKDSFKFNKKYSSSPINNLLIFDDIATTGSSFIEINKILKNQIKYPYNFITIAISNYHKNKLLDS